MFYSLLGHLPTAPDPGFRFWPVIDGKYKLHTLVDTNTVTSRDGLILECILWHQWKMQVASVFFNCSCSHRVVTVVEMLDDPAYFWVEIPLGNISQKAQNLLTVFPSTFGFRPHLITSTFSNCTQHFIKLYKLHWHFRNPCLPFKLNMMTGCTNCVHRTPLYSIQHEQGFYKSHQHESFFEAICFSHWF